MCSITAIIDYNKPAVHNSQIISIMNDETSHRGPDSSGIVCVMNAALAHRRLSIIDIAGGGQPMSRTIGNRTAIIIYNGELYNTPEVRKQLKEEGIQCTSTSDTEVLLMSYFAWGTKCVEKLVGIFAFAIYDTLENKLFCARDRFGVKPFFYTLKDGMFILASEIKSILAHPHIKAELDRDGLCEIFGLSPARTNGCGVLKGIKELEPAHTLVLTKESMKIARYYDITARKHNENLKDTIMHVKQLVQNSIETQLVSDVELGCFLSGGLDSSIISSIAAENYRQKGKRLKTFSIEYEGNRENFKSNKFQPEADFMWTEKVSDYVKSNHYVITLNDEELIASLKDALIARDLPGMVDIDSSLLLFCRKVKEHVTVALSGECADEIFGGYPWYHDKSMWIPDVFPWSNNVHFRKSFLNKELRYKLPITEYIRHRYQNTVKKAQCLDSDSIDEKIRRQMFRLNTDWFMANLLERKDRMSMASGLEVRVPYCDYHLAEYVYNIPWEIKNHGGYEKGILREAAREFLPHEIRYRKKSPYPKTFSPVYSNAVFSLLDDVLENKYSPIFELVDREQLMLTCREHSNTTKPWFGQLMSGPQLAAYMWQLNYWLTTYNIKITC